MAIYTPRGLKIRLPIDYGFALMTRLYPRITPFKFLKVTEALELLPAAWASIAAVLAFLTLKSPYTICAVIVGVQIIAHVMRMSALPIPRIFTDPANVYSYGSGYGMFLILICALGYFKLSWQGVAAFLVARAAAGLVNGIIAWVHQFGIHRKTGLAVTTSEIVFLNTYTQLARRFGVEMDLSVKDDELKEENWRGTLNQLAMEWPEVVARFTPD